MSNKENLDYNKQPRKPKSHEGYDANLRCLATSEAVLSVLSERKVNTSPTEGFIIFKKKEKEFSMDSDILHDKEINLSISPPFYKTIEHSPVFTLPKAKLTENKKKISRYSSLQDSPNKKVITMERSYSLGDFSMEVDILQASEGENNESKDYQKENGKHINLPKYKIGSKRKESSENPLHDEAIEKYIDIHPSDLPTLLNCFCHRAYPQIKRISSTTYLDAKPLYDQVITVDCRFSYEYDGGHIAEAINISQLELLKDYFFKNPKRYKKSCIVFYCEFSSHRAPTMFLQLRSLDRSLNIYPALFFPEIYVLDGGYSKFYSEYPSKCNPCGYVKMDDPLHKTTRDIMISKSKKNRSDI